MGGKDGLKRIGIIAGIEHLGSNGHWRWSEILYLLQLVTHAAGEVGQLRHILLVAARM